MQARCNDGLSDKVQKLRASHSDAAYGNQSVGMHMAYDIADLFARRERERFAMHSRNLNEQMVRVLKAIGYDVGFCRGESSTPTGEGRP